MDQEIEKRLDRMESKMDTITDVMVSLARSEEKIATLMERQRYFEDTVDEMKQVFVDPVRIGQTFDEVKELNHNQASIKTELSTIKRVVYGLVGLILTAVVIGGLSQIIS